MGGFQVVEQHTSTEFVELFAVKPVKGAMIRGCDQLSLIVVVFLPHSVSSVVRNEVLVDRMVY